MRYLLNLLIHKAVAWCKKNNRVFYITGEATDKEDVYLVRYIVLKSELCCIYIHRFMRSDSSDPHDHPWNFFTYIVSGGYTEHFYDVTKPQTNKDWFFYGVKEHKYTSFWTMRENVRKPGSFAFRRATDIHRVVIPRTFKLNEIEQAPLTACIMFNRKRHWGFWPLKDKGSKFVDWRRYLKIRPSDPRIQGSE
jgi:hypothetical protein